MEPDPLLCVTDLACARGGVPVLAGVGLRLLPGCVLVLRGPNGIGKTTLLRTIAGLQPPLSGRIVMAEDAVAYGAHADGLKAVLSVAENLTFWARLFGRRDIAPALAAYDLGALADRPAQALSAGQKRRLGLARLLVTGRPVWLLDEPTVSLDAAAVRLFAAALAGHLAAGGGAIVATHIDLGFEAEVLDLSAFRTAPGRMANGFDEAFL